MTEQRPERRLPTLLEDLYLGPTPDYRDEVLAAAVARRQRPSWTFPGRWLPVTDIALRPAIAPGPSWRLVGAVLAAALLLAAALAIAGAWPTRVPAPFGPAANGLIAYATDGDIHVADPVANTSRTIVSGPDIDRDPVFSPDGTRIAFLRERTVDGRPATDIVVVRADGSRPVTITSEPLPRGPSRVEWSPDSRSLLVGSGSETELWTYDATRAAPPVTAETGARTFFRPFRPPDGTAVLVTHATGRGQALALLDLGSGTETVLVDGIRGHDLTGARWSPDGSWITFSTVPEDDPNSRRLFIVGADGTGLRQLTPVAGASSPGAWFDLDPAWSPDGTRIAFTRYEQTDQTAPTWDVRPIAIYALAGGSIVEAGPIPRDVRASYPSAADTDATYGEGWFVDWSPDGTTLLALPSEAAGHPVVIDAATGDWRVLDPIVDPAFPAQAWQRTAP